MARKCCSPTGSPTSEDDCMCGCGYMNGCCPIILSQLILFFGVIFSAATIWDCSFVEISYVDETSEPNYLTQLRLGMWTYQEDGMCYWWWSSSLPVKDQLDWYWDEVLGPDWHASISMAYAAFAIGVTCFLYMTSYCCSAQTRPVRIVTGAILAIVCVTLQCLTFMVYNSQWCEDNGGCSFSRSAGWSVGAAGAYFLAGILFCFTSNYPGYVEPADAPKYDCAVVVPGYPSAPYEQAYPPAYDPAYAPKDTTSDADSEEGSSSDADSEEGSSSDADSEEGSWSCDSSEGVIQVHATAC